MYIYVYMCVYIYIQFLWFLGPRSLKTEVSGPCGFYNYRTVSRTLIPKLGHEVLLLGPWFKVQSPAKTFFL